VGQWIFLHAIAQTTQSRAKMCLLVVKKLKLIFNVFIQKITMAPMEKISQFFKQFIKYYSAAH